MPTLLDRAAGLASKIAEYQKLKVAADNAEQFQTRANQFENLTEQITCALDALEALSDSNVGVSFRPIDGVCYAGKAKTLRAAIRDDPTVIDDPPFDLKHEFIDRISGFVVDADKAMNAAWRDYIAERSDLGADDVLSAFAGIPQFRPEIATIQQCRREIDTLGNRLPTDPRTAVAQLDELVIKHNTAWSALSAEDIPPAVISFIRAAANEGVALAAYSDEVRAWLERRDLINVFRIRLR